MPSEFCKMIKEYYKPKITEFEIIPMKEAKKLGYIPYAGPYKPTVEKFMIENAIIDILNNGRDKYCIVKIGSVVEIWVIPSYYRSGWVKREDFNGKPDTTATDATETNEAIQDMEAEGNPTPDQPEVTKITPDLQGISD